MSLGDDLAGFVDHVLAGADGPHVLLGPIVWRPAEGGGRRWYFCTVTGGEDGDFRSDMIEAGDKATVEAALDALWRRFLAHRPALVVHSFDDELKMARWTAAIWPSALSKALAEAIELERALSERPVR